MGGSSYLEGRMRSAAPLAPSHIALVPLVARPGTPELVRITHTTLPDADVLICFDLSQTGFSLETDVMVDAGACAHFEFRAWDGFYVTLQATAIYSRRSSLRMGPPRQLSTWEFADPGNATGVEALLAAASISVH